MLTGGMLYLINENDLGGADDTEIVVVRLVVVVDLLIEDEATAL